MINPLNMCNGKQRYETANQVHKAVARHNSISKTGKPVKGYYCNECKGWHYGHESRKKKLRYDKEHFTIHHNHESGIHRVINKFDK